VEWVEKGLAGMVPPQFEGLTLLNGEAAALPEGRRHRIGEGLTDLDDRASKEALKEAERVLMQVLFILNNPICENRANASWSLKLARAHALTLLDHLAAMVNSQP